MEAIADNVIRLLGHLASQEIGIICNFQDDLESMRSMVTAIKAVLLDAETKATKSHLINDWLQKLKDVLLDADDLLDAYLADELAREVTTKGKMAKEVRIFFSKSNRIVCAAKMGREIKAIRKKLDCISNEKNTLNLIQISSSESNYERRQTHSFVGEEDVVGRGNERMQLVGVLLNPPDVVKDNNVSVVAIVGIGGLGKTTLAQQAYNDEAIKRHFELMKWVCVSDDESTDNKFNIKRVAENIIGKEYREMEQVAQGLRETIEGKRFLLVLDDMWNENREKWLELEKLLKGGKKGSMIIVTTRSKKVAQIMGIHPLLLISIKVLDANNSWELFRRVAFWDGKEPDNQELISIGKDIVSKCAGVPLAIRTIGSLLLTEKLEVREWSYFRDTKLANIGSDDNRVLSILKLSYDHLPSHLKNCFAFCSLFPKDYVIQRKVLIQMWIAGGFIQSLDKHRRLEDVGDEYFMQLLLRCLFQDVMRDDFGDIKWCKMHDLIHDLALSITKNESYIVTSQSIEENIGDGIRHISIHFDGVWEFQFGNVKTRRVRTILSPIEWSVSTPSRSPSRFLNPIYRSTTSLPKHLRVLDLSGKWLGILKSIGYLKHLRYLGLSWNWDLKKLPRGITKLHNLVSLRLIGCKSLIQLPRDMKRLVSLRHLELDACDNLICMPHGLGSLTYLQTLTTFVVDKRSGAGARISELLGLISLRGGLKIKNLERQRSNVEEVESPLKFLLHMQYLERLSLMWSRVFLDEEFSEEEEHKDEIILEALEPPHTIKILDIVGFHGKCLSEWIGSLTSLQVLELESCFALVSLPESIGSLVSLQKLNLHNCNSLVSLPESIGSLTSLQELSLDYFPALTSLPESIGSLTSLQVLRIYNSYVLASLPESIGSLTSLQNLDLCNCPSLALLPESIGSLTSLRKLSVNYCSNLASLPESIGSLTSLQHLSLVNCISLASLPDSVKCLTSLKYFCSVGCSALMNRYGQELEGFDWPELSHIPDVHIS